MSTYDIEQYELHVQRYEVEADSAAEAIAKLFKGEADPVDNSLEYVEVCEDRGLPAEENQQLAKQLRALEISVGKVIPSIRCVARID